MKRTVKAKRAQLSAIREEVEELFDSVDVLEAGARDEGKPRATLAGVKKCYGLK
jgi:hypothetical protein